MFQSYKKTQDKFKRFVNLSDLRKQKQSPDSPPDSPPDSL